MLRPSKEEFVHLSSQGNLIPVYRELVSDLETPVSAYLKLDRPGQVNFLLESAESAERFGRHSFLGFDPGMILEIKDGEARVVEKGECRRYRCGGDPLAELQKLMAVYRPVALPELPLFHGGAVGYLSYEAVRFFEPSVPRAVQDDLQLPDAVFLLTDTLLIFDHFERTLRVVANVHVDGDAAGAYDRAAAKIDALCARLASAGGGTPVEWPGAVPEVAPQVNMTKEQYVAMTARMQEFIRAGDIFQVVPSQRFSAEYGGEPITLYRALRQINPSPYMFCLKLGGHALVGASPEVHVRCEQGLVQIRPIAGTRPRGETAAQDLAYEQELLADPKERAEHVMLVDLARNDVGRACEFHSVKVTEFMTVERYSHVMHIVSNVEGKLRQDRNSYDVMRATFPAGTVSGSPKIRAMQIIAEGEPTCRGSYAGAVGYFGYGGNLDCCIALRTVLLKDGVAHVQAGGGLVADSTPEGEYNESCNKAKAAMKALAVARVLDASAAGDDNGDAGLLSRPDHLW